MVLCHSDVNNFVNNTTINEHTAFNGLAIATTLAEDLDATETAIDVTSASNLRNNDVIKINDEQMLISSISSNTLTVVRGHNSTTATTHTNADDIDNSFQIFKDDSKHPTRKFNYGAAARITLGLNRFSYPILTNSKNAKNLN